MKRDVEPGAPRPVEAEKITAIQTTSGSQCLQNRSYTAQRNNGDGAKANEKRFRLRESPGHRSGWNRSSAPVR